jgi:UDP-N-acetyl-D-mannosaminuronate dehydrogenase
MHSVTFSADTLAAADCVVIITDHKVFDHAAIVPLLDVFVEGSNLFDVSYQEVAGVRMPGAAMTVSLALRARE